MCNMCKVVQERKNAGFPKRTIRSVASWWWLNVHDDLCTKDYKIPSWVQNIFKPNHGTVDCNQVMQTHIFDDLRES